MRKSCRHSSTTSRSGNGWRCGRRSSSTPVETTLWSSGTKSPKAGRAASWWRRTRAPCKRFVTARSFESAPIWIGPKPSKPPGCPSSCAIRPRPRSPTFAGSWRSDLLRVHVHRDRDLAEGAAADRGPDRVTDRRDRGVALLGLDDQAAAALAAQPEESCRPEQVAGGAETIGEQLPNRLRGCLDPCLVHPGQHDLDQV